jgi:hypothetical protein
MVHLLQAQNVCMHTAAAATVAESDHVHMGNRRDLPRYLACSLGHVHPVPLIRSSPLRRLTDGIMYYNDAILILHSYQVPMVHCITQRHAQPPAGGCPAPVVANRIG